MSVYRSSRLRGKCTCPPGSACYNKISCDPAHVATTTALMSFSSISSSKTRSYTDIWRLSFGCCVLLGTKTQHRVRNEPCLPRPSHSPKVEIEIETGLSSRHVVRLAVALSKSAEKRQIVPCDGGVQIRSVRYDGLSSRSP
jgi:hypothetical protein